MIMDFRQEADTFLAGCCIFFLLVVVTSVLLLLPFNQFVCLFVCFCL